MLIQFKKMSIFLNKFEHVLIYIFTQVAFFIPRHTIVAGYCGFILVVFLSVICPSIFSFPDDNLSKLQWIFIKLSMCIDIVEIWFGVAINGQISSIFYVICPP